MADSHDLVLIRNALIDNYNAYAQGLDSKDWALVRSCFADEIYLDYGTLNPDWGDPSLPRDADDWLEVLQGVINGFDIPRHTITNHRVVVDGDAVSCRAYLIADHVKFRDPAVPFVGPEDVVTVVGEYTNVYTRQRDSWKIQRSQLVVNWTSGNPALVP